VVIDDLDILGTALAPAEAEAPAFIDADAPLPGAPLAPHSLSRLDVATVWCGIFLFASGNAHDMDRVADNIGLTLFAFGDFRHHCPPVASSKVPCALRQSPDTTQNNRVLA